MGISEIVSAISQTVALIISTPATAILSLVGLLLLLLAAGLAYLAITRDVDKTTTLLKSSLFVSLIGGMLFSAAGPGLALFWVSKNSIKQTSTEQAFDNLEQNAQVRWLIRLIPFDPLTDPQLKVGRLEMLGPKTQFFTFVGNYEELVGYTARDALQMTGGTYVDGMRISAVIFRLRGNLYPASARGLLQVIQEVEARKDIDLPNKFLAGTNVLNSGELDDLKSTSIGSYRLEAYTDKYSHYCELAHQFQCGISFSARDHIGGLNPDWHPLGFSKQKTEDVPCRNMNDANYCKFSDWKSAKANWRRQFGSRAFLIRNLAINDIDGRVLIDFDQPDHQVIPNIGTR